MAAVFSFATCSFCHQELFRDADPPEQRYCFIGSCSHRLCLSCVRNSSPCPVCGMSAHFKRSNFNNASHVVELLASVLSEVVYSMRSTAQSLETPQIADLEPPVADLFSFPIDQRPSWQYAPSHHRSYAAYADPAPQHTNFGFPNEMMWAPSYPHATAPPTASQYAPRWNEPTLPRSPQYDPSRSEKIAELEKFHALPAAPRSAPQEAPQPTMPYSSSTPKQSPVKVEPTIAKKPPPPSAKKAPPPPKSKNPNRRAKANSAIQGTQQSAKHTLTHPALGAQASTGAGNLQNPQGAAPSALTPTTPRKAARTDAANAFLMTREPSIESTTAHQVLSPITHPTYHNEPQVPSKDNLAMKAFFDGLRSQYEGEEGADGQKKFR